MAQLECRIVITFKNDGRVDLGMYDPISNRYEPLGTHGPSLSVIDKVIEDLKTSIIRAGHNLTFCERSE